MNVRSCAFEVRETLHGRGAVCGGWLDRGTVVLEEDAVLWWSRLGGRPIVRQEDQEVLSILQAYAQAPHDRQKLADTASSTITNPSPPLTDLVDRWRRSITRLRETVGFVGERGVDDWMLVVLRAQLNAHEVGGDGLKVGLFPRGAIVNHACAPTAIYRCTDTPTGGTITFTLLTPHPPNTEITASYLSAVDLLLPRSYRREKLALSKGFVCECTRCVAEGDVVTDDVDVARELYERWVGLEVGGWDEVVRMVEEVDGRLPGGKNHYVAQLYRIAAIEAADRFSPDTPQLTKYALDHATWLFNLSKKENPIVLLGTMTGTMRHLLDLGGRRGARFVAGVVAWENGLLEIAREVAVVARVKFGRDGAYTRALEQAVANATRCGNVACENEGIEGLQACARCKQVRYCSRDCQVAHWKASPPAASHRVECKDLALALEKLNKIMTTTTATTAEQTTAKGDAV
ncbi:hypothetical protein PYCC9005_003438 [Savitreella phatthalungensis]